MQRRHVVHKAYLPRRVPGEAPKP
eukprot:COSAG01_NODE_44195_length_421_cov_2.568323_1_plen_23_part_10